MFLEIAVVKRDYTSIYDFLPGGKKKNRLQARTTAKVTDQRCLRRSKWSIYTQHSQLKMFMIDKQLYIILNPLQINNVI